MNNNTHLVKLGGFRYTNGIGQLTKIYVYAGIQSVDDSETVLIKQYILSENRVYGWLPAKTFKGKTLYIHQSHIKFSTLVSIVKIVDNAAPEVYIKMRKQLKS